MSKRIALTDGSGKWFSSETAQLFKEDTYWNGNNWISKATGSQWAHESLYRTAGGRFILNHWSNWQGSSETYEEIGNEEAAVWFSKNGLEPHPACIMKVTIELSDKEVKALKAYLKEVSNDVDPVITKADIEKEVKGMVSGCMQTGSLGDYYQLFVNS